MEKLASGYGLIEGPVWHQERGLIFSDVLGGGVYALDDDGEVTTVFEHRRGIGGMALHASGTGLIVSGRNIAFKPFDGGATVVVHELDPGPSGVGFNDLTTDHHGRIYVGELRSSPFDDQADKLAGQLWLIDLDGSAKPVAPDVLLTNGLGFSPDNTTLYHSDSTRRAVMKYAVHSDGTLGPKELFTETSRGVPDGLVVSEDGSVWVALAAGGGGVAVFDPDGGHRDHLAVDEPMCTSVCFGGPNNQDLYVVTGSEGADSDHAGSVWVHPTDVAGCLVSPANVPI